MGAGKGKCKERSARYILRCYGLEGGLLGEHQWAKKHEFMDKDG